MTSTSNPSVETVRSPCMPGLLMLLVGIAIAAGLLIYSAKSEWVGRPVAGGEPAVRLIELGVNSDVPAQSAGKPGLQFTGDGHVLFLARYDASGASAHLLYSAPLDGSAPASVRNGPLVAGGLRTAGRLVHEPHACL